MPEPIVEAEKSTEEIQKEALGAKPVEPVVEPVIEPTPVVPPIDKSTEAITAINQTLAKQTELLNTLLAQKDEKAGDKEWTLEQLRDAELKVYSGEYEQKWMPLINEKRATIIAKQIASDEKAQYTKDAQWEQINQRWNNGIQRAAQDFGKDAADPNSRLFKTAQDLIFKDPGYKRFNELKAGGKSINQIDPSLIDPDLQYKCFEIAHSRITRLDKDSPNPTPPGSKAALGGATLPKPDAERAASLEARATNDPNDQRAWLDLMKEGIRQNRSR